MKKFFINIITFGFCLVILDVFVGFLSGGLGSSANGGLTRENYYIAKESLDDIIILGSSRAKHHYDPFIIEDSLGMSCYNMGLDGNGIILAYGRYKMLLERYTPKLIIYEVSTSFDIYKYDENTRYLTNLRQYYDVEGVKNIVDQIIDEKEKIKMQSVMYRNNSKLLPAVIDNVINRNLQKGYVPLYRVMNEPVKDFVSKENVLEIDSAKLNLFESFICDVKSKDIGLILMVSPTYRGKDCENEYCEVIKLCNKYNVKFVCNNDMVGIVDDYRLFQDRAHMNNTGANKYTCEIIPFLREELNN